MGLDERGDSMPEKPGGCGGSEAPARARERAVVAAAAKSAIVGVGGPNDGIGSVGADQDDTEVSVYDGLAPVSDKKSYLPDTASACDDAVRDSSMWCEEAPAADPDPNPPKTTLSSPGAALLPEAPPSLAPSGPSLRARLFLSLCP